MISEISKRIAVGLSRSSVIAEEDIDLYTYGFFSLLSKLLFFLVTAFFGILLKITVESILFYVLFSLLRTYAGGIHADKEWKCLCFTTIAMFLSVLGIKLLIYFKPTIISILMLTISSIIIIILSPLNTKEKTLSNCERKRYKKISHFIILIYIIIIIIFFNLGFYKYYYSIMVALVLESILLLIGIINNKTGKE